MAQQIIDNGDFDNDPDAEKIRLAFGKTNANFTELYNLVGNNGKLNERVLAWIPGVATTELAQVANSVNNAVPSIVVPSGVLQVVSFMFYYGGGFGVYYKKSSYVIKKGAGTYGATGSPIVSGDLFKLEPVISGINESATFDLGDIGGADVWDYVNDNGNYLVVGTTIFETTEGNYVFSGPDGLYGDGQLQTDEDNFIPLTDDLPAGYDLTKIIPLDLTGINTDQDERWYVRDAVVEYGPFSVEPASNGDQQQQMVFVTQTPNGDGSISLRYYRFIRNLTTIGGPLALGIINPEWFMPDGNMIIDPVNNPELFIQLGDIGAGPVEDAFNDGDPDSDPVNEPWLIEGEKFITAILDGDNTIWRWIGGDGEFGGTGGTEAVAGDFQNLSAQPSVLPTDQNSMIITDEVLDTDLDTVDIAGLVDYYNELVDGVEKFYYHASWFIEVKNAGGDVLKEFLLVNRGKGPIGLEAIASNPAFELTANMFREVNKIRNPQSVTTSNETIPAIKNGETIFSDGDTHTFNPNTVTYPDNFEIIITNTNASEASFIGTAMTGWTYIYNNQTPVSSITAEFLKSVLIERIKDTDVVRITEIHDGALYWKTNDWNV